MSSNRRGRLCLPIPRNGNGTINFKRHQEAREIQQATDPYDMERASNNDKEWFKENPEKEYRLRKQVGKELPSRTPFIIVFNFVEGMRFKVPLTFLCLSNIPAFEKALREGLDTIPDENLLSIARDNGVNECRPDLGEVMDMSPSEKQQVIKKFRNPKRRK